MKNLIKAAVVILFAASDAQAQQAVQWKVSSGGNGRWYGVDRFGGQLSWSTAEARALQAGGSLACISSSAENAFVFGLIGSDSSLWNSQHGPWIGARRDNGQWSWVNGEPWAFQSWCGGTGDVEHRGQYWSCFGTTPGPDWNDHFGDTGPVSGPLMSRAAVIEWSADCNGDGIVDYGQCRNGSLPDYNQNNTPDCCESGGPCVVGNYPVQWRPSEGGNGHWYQLQASGNLITWSASRTLALAVGGHLATLTSNAENDWVFANVAPGPQGWACQGDCYGPWLGGFQDRSAADFIEPAGGWRWVTGEPWDFTAWSCNLPNEFGSPGQPQDFLHFYAFSGCSAAPGARWNDESDVRAGAGGLRGYITEWSADCNGDGIVDYGQLLQGQLPDTNSNGIPDGCECSVVPTLPACCVGDLNQDSAVDGADLGTLLNSWGACPGTCPADFDRNGFVNGADLGVLLGRWGPCG